MKKTLAIILAIVMMAAMAVPAFATQEITSGTGSSEVEYTVDDEYTVVIPQKITLSKDAVTADVTVTKAVIKGNQTLTVKMHSTQGTNGKWQLETTTGGYAVEYNISIAEKNEGKAEGAQVTLTAGEFANGGANSANTLLTVKSVATVGENEHLGAATLTFTTAGTAQAGTYTDSITFTISVDTPEAG